MARTTQPQGVLAVDYSSPLTVGLAFLALPGQAREILNGARASVSLGKVVGTVAGTAYSVEGETTIQHYEYDPRYSVGDGDFTMLVMLDVVGASSFWNGLLSQRAGIGSPGFVGIYTNDGLKQFFLEYRDNGNTPTSYQWDVTSFGVRKNAQYAVTRGGPVVSAYVDGQARPTTGTFTNPIGDGNTSKTCIGVIRNDLESENVLGDYFLAAIWRRTLGPDEIAAIYDNPWQLFAAPAARSIRVPGAIVQLLAPTSDISAGAWTPSTGTDLYAMLDEATADDADYITTESASTAEVAFGTGLDPASSTGHTIRYRAKGTGTLTVTLRQGATLIATHVPTLTESYQTFSFTLSGAEADSISDYSALRLRFVSS